jgi:hypothetical protein
MYVCPSAREHVVGWYSTGPRLREADLSIHQLMTNYCANPVLVICEVEVGSLAAATAAAAVAMAELRFGTIIGVLKCVAFNHSWLMSAVTADLMVVLSQRLQELLINVMPCFWSCRD